MHCVLSFQSDWATLSQMETDTWIGCSFGDRLVGANYPAITEKISFSCKITPQKWWLKTVLSQGLFLFIFFNVATNKPEWIHQLTTLVAEGLKLNYKRSPWRGRHAPASTLDTGCRVAGQSRSAEHAWACRVPCSDSPPLEANYSVTTAVADVHGLQHVLMRSPYVSRHYE